MRETEVRLGAALEPFETGADTIATVAIVPVASPAEEPQMGQAWVVSDSSDLQVMQRSM